MDKGDKNMKTRIFNIMQYQNHPETGDQLLTEEQIKSGLDHKSIDKWVYILHDKDVYHEEDELNDPTKKAGDKKPPHWHIVLQFKSAVEIGIVSKWFGVPENFIEVPKGFGRDKFLDCVQYLTHEDEKQQLLEKYRYPDEEVKASPNFNFRKKLDDRLKNLEKYGRDISYKDQIMIDVMNGRKTLADVEAEDQVFHQKYIKELQAKRNYFLQKCKPPALRINFYVYGLGGNGKDAMSRYLAMALFPEAENIEDLIFDVGAGNVTFEGYDGQPILIWSDRRSLQLVKALGGKENFFNVFDPIPRKIRQNIKGSSVNLLNTINIVNGQESYEDFLDNIVKVKNDKGEYVIGEDRGQSYRRFPFIIPVNDKYFDILYNRGFINNNRSEFCFYDLIARINGKVSDIAAFCGNDEELQREAAKECLETLKKQYDIVIKEKTCKPKSKEELHQWLLDNGIGKILESDETNCNDEEIFKIDDEDIYPIDDSPIDDCQVGDFYIIEDEIEGN